MPINVYELARSREQTSATAGGSSLTLLFLAVGSEDDAAIHAAVTTASPATYSTLRRQSVGLSPQGGGVWEATVTYGPDDAGPDGPSDPGATPPDPPASTDPLTQEFSFDTSGATEHVTQSLNTRLSIKAGGGAASDFKQAIGVSKDGVAGADRVAPKFEFSITRELNFVNLEYLRTLRRMTGRVNEATFLGFAAYEVLFMGASGTVGADGKCKVTWKFAAGLNQTGVEVSDEITLSSVRAWEHVWCAYGQSVDGDLIVSRPVAAYVEEIYRPADFASLGVY